jgi:hypothetical protein
VSWSIPSSTSRPFASSRQRRLDDHPNEAVADGDPGDSRLLACKAPTPFIDARHHAKHLCPSRNATLAPRHATHTYPSEPPRPSLTIPLARRQGDTESRVSGRTLAFRRAGGDTLRRQPGPPRALRLSACRGQGLPERSRLRVPNATVSEGLAHRLHAAYVQPLPKRSAGSRVCGLRAWGRRSHFGSGTGVPRHDVCR